MTHLVNPSWKHGALAFVGALLLALGTASAVKAQQRVVPENAGAIKQSFAPVVKKAAPAVVNVYARRKVEQMDSPFANDPFFSRLFGQNFGVPRERVQNSLGSGVIVSADGVVVTNNHVIQGGGPGAEVTVVLADGREFPADLISKDEQTDLAVLRLEAKGIEFPSLEFDDSDGLEVGDLVLAIGNPFGVGQTVTSGIVSALARTKVGISDYQFFIQTDAAINPGNSGGALVDIDGKLVGINTAIFSRSGGSHGIGFAIPSNMVRLVVQSALQGGKVLRPWFGASLQPVTPDIADSLGLDRPRGALVKELNGKGPAAKAGLAAGDVILSVDGREIADPQSFHYRFATKSIGSVAAIELWRRGKPLKASVARLAPVEQPPRDMRVLEGRHPFAGATVANLSPAVAQELAMEDDGRAGVVVLDVAPRSTAARLGLKRGDLVVSVNDSRIRDVAALEESLGRGPGIWRLSLQRGERLFNIAVQG